MLTEDGRIIQECLNGEPEAFGVLVDKYREGIYAFVYNKLRNFQDAQDVTQEVFLQAYRGLRNLRRWESFAFWLYRIAYARCSQWLRIRLKRVDRDYIEDKDQREMDASSLDSYRESQLDESVQEALDALSVAYREVLILRYFGGMSSGEIAKALGASPTAIRMRLSRARAQFKEEMINMMGTAFESKRLPVGFTFRVVESIKHIDINPMPRMIGLPWGISLATGVLLTVLSLSPNLNLHNPMDNIINSPLPSEKRVMEVGELPVDVLKISQIPNMAGSSGYSNGAGSMLPDEQNALLSAPGAEGYTFPDKPTRRLGKGFVQGRLCYSPNGKLLAVAGSIGIWLYNTESMKEIGFLEGHTYGSWAVAFSPDGKLLASGGAGSDKTVRLWNVELQKEIAILEGHGSLVWAVAFSPNGKLLASSSHDNTVLIWDVDALKQVAVLKGHTNAVDCVLFSPDGKILASGGRDKMIRLWSVGGWEKIAEFNTDSVTSMSFSPDGKLLASGGGGNAVWLWDMDNQKQVAVFKGHTSWVNSIAFSPDGRTIASGSSDSSVRLWSVDEQKQIAVLWGGSAHSVAFSPDGKTLASGESNMVRFWDVNARKQVDGLIGYTTEVWSVAFSPDGELLAWAGSDKIVQLWDMKGQKQVGKLVGHRWGVNSVAFSPDGKTIASGSDDKTIQLWNVNEQKLVGTLTGHTGTVYSVAFSPDGKTIASGSDDKTVRIWDVVERKLIVTLIGHKDYVYSVAFSPDGKLLASGSYDNTTRLWDMQGQKEIAALNEGRYVMSVAFSPDGKTLATGGAGRTVRLWNVGERKELTAFSHKSGTVFPVTFSPDGKLVASGGWDRVIMIWDVQAQKEIATLEGHFSIMSSLAFSPDGKWLASGNRDGTVLLWEVNVGGPAISVKPMGKLPSTWGEMKKTALLQNFPNPFNPETWIPYQLAESVDVIIRIYNASGNLVRTLDIGHKPAGFYADKGKAACWDGRNAVGEKVSSGAYFYTFQAGDFKATKKMVVSN